MYSRRNTFSQTVTTLGAALDLRDPYTAEHSRRVAEYSRLVATDLGLSAAAIGHVEQAALLHDIGKVGVPDSVLFKNCPLDADDWTLIRTHPQIGAQLIADIPGMRDVYPSVLHHHEHVDGSGYPDGLKGDEIPLGARIIAVADAFDAMTTDRPYRRGLDSAAAIQELQRGAGTHFDKRCLRTFVRLVTRGAISPPLRGNGEVRRFAQRVVIDGYARA